MDSGPGSQDNESNLVSNDTEMPERAAQNKVEDFNWKLPIFGAIGFGISFALMGAIMVTIYNMAQNSYNTAFEIPGAGPGAGIFRGIIVGAIGGGAMGLAFKNKMQTYNFSLAGAIGFAIAFALVISLDPDIVPGLGEVFIRLMGGPRFLSSFEISLAHGLGAGTFVGAIGGLALGLASPKGRIAASLLLCFTGTIWFANAFAFGNVIYDGNFHSAWNGWAGAIGGGIFGLTLAVFYKIYAKTHPGETIPADSSTPVRVDESAETQPAASRTVNQIGYWSALLTTVSATLLSISPWMLMYVLPFRHVVPPSTATWLNILSAGLSIVGVFGFAVLVACVARVTIPAKMAWPWVGLVCAVLAVGCMCLEISPLTRSGVDFRRLLLPYQAGPDNFIFWKAVFSGMAGLCILPYFWGGRLKQLIRHGLLILTAAIILTTVAAVLSIRNILVDITMLVQMVVFPLTVGLMATMFRRGLKTTRLA